MILFVTILTVIIWFWAAGQTTHESDVTTTVRFRPPEGSTITVSPMTASVMLTLSGPRSAVNSAKDACKEGIELTITPDDSELTSQKLLTMVNALDAIRNTGAEVVDTIPTSFTLTVLTMHHVEAAVEVVLSGVTVSGDVTVDPATVMLSIPSHIRDKLPEAITVNAIVSDAALEQLQPGVVHKRDAVIRLPAELDTADVTIVPNRVSVTFKIQSKTQKTTLQQIRVLIASPAEDYAAYSVFLPRTIISNVTIEADTAIITGIEKGDVTVFAIVRLASRDMEQRIDNKTVTTFLAIMEDGTGHEVIATVEDPAVLNIELLIEPVTLQPTP